MRWLIDGYNVIRRDADLRGAEEQSLRSAREALVRLVAGVARRSSAERFVVVFDGDRVSGSALPGPGGPGAPAIEVVFSRPPETADDVLVRLARQHRESAVVVTSDRTVQHAAARADCTVVDAEQFVRAIDAGEAARPPGSGDDETDDEADRSSGKRGNPRRVSRAERSAQRALARLRGR
jgi:predicted RNA-binding protein with PIN domain